MFSYIYVILHRVITRPYFVEVFGLPDHPMLADVNAVLKQSSGEKYVSMYISFIHVLCIGIHWYCSEMFLKELGTKILMLDLVHSAPLTNCC